MIAGEKIQVEKANREAERRKFWLRAAGREDSSSSSESPSPQEKTGFITQEESSSDSSGPDRSRMMLADLYPAASASTAYKFVPQV